MNFNHKEFSVVPMMDWFDRHVDKLLLLIKIVMFYYVTKYAFPSFYICFKELCRWTVKEFPACKDYMDVFFQLDYGRFAKRVSIFIVTLIIYFFFIKCIDREEISKSVLNPPSSKLKFFIYGAALGIFTTGITIGLILTTKSAILHPNLNWMNALIPVIFLYVVAMAMTALSEELIMRGYLLQNLFKVINPHAAIFLTSFLFGYWHLSASPLYAVMAFVFGLIAGYGFLWTKNLYFCIGLHFAGNVFESVVFSKYLSFVVVNNPLLSGDRNITPDREGLLSLPALFIGLMIVVLIRQYYKVGRAWENSI